MILKLLAFSSSSGSSIESSSLKSYVLKWRMLYVGRKTDLAIACISSTVPSLCPNRLKYLSLLRDVSRFVCSSTEQQGLLVSSCSTRAFYSMDRTEQGHRSDGIYELQKRGGATPPGTPGTYPQYYLVSRGRNICQPQCLS